MEEIILDFKCELMNNNLQPFLTSHAELFVDYIRILDQSGLGNSEGFINNSV